MKPGSRVTKEEIEEFFDYGFGYQIRGINRVKDENGVLDSILVFSKDEGPYEDSKEGTRFTYWGEIQNGEYKTAYNRALIRSIVDEIPVHFFHKENSEKKWRYMGDIDVVGVEETKDRQNRINYKFRFESR